MPDLGSRADAVHQRLPLPVPPGDPGRYETMVFRRDCEVIKGYEYLLINPSSTDTSLVW